MNIKDIRIRDPFIIKDGLLYYLTGTTNKKNFEYYKSKNLKEFEGPFILFDPSDYNINTECAWAPEIHRFNNKFYLFITLKEMGKKRGTYIAVSNSVSGKFELISKHPITPNDWSCLDGSLFIDNNIPYMVFCREWIDTKDGEMYIVKLSDNLSEMASTPILLFRAHKDTKWSTPIFGDGYVTDGPFIFKQNGEYRMLWSSFYGEKYALSIIKSKSLLSGWEQEETPFLSNDCGHGMIFEKDGKLILTVHSPNSKPNERIKFINFN